MITGLNVGKNISAFLKVGRHTSQPGKDLSLNNATTISQNIQNPFLPNVTSSYLGKQT